MTCGTCDGVQTSSRSALLGLPGSGLAPTRSGGIPVAALRVWCCRCDSEHRFWKPSEVDTEVDSAAVSEMLQSRYITFAGKFEPVQHRCHAPRPDGRLCERQDRLKVRRGPGLVRATGTQGRLPQGPAGPGQGGRVECWAPAGQCEAGLGPPQGGLVRGWQASLSHCLVPGVGSRHRDLGCLHVFPRPCCPPEAALH